MSESNENKSAASGLAAPPGSPLEDFGREILTHLYYSGEGLLDADGFVDRWMDRAEELGLLKRAEAVNDSDYSFFWLRTFLAGGELDRQRLLDDGQIKENDKDLARRAQDSE